jgi:hypothetical protein
MNKSEKAKPVIEFEIMEVNEARRARGAEWIRVRVYVDGVYDDLLWMNKTDIEKNKKEHGSFRNSLDDFKK